MSPAPPAALAHRAQLLHRRHKVVVVGRILRFRLRLVVAHALRPNQPEVVAGQVHHALRARDKFGARRARPLQHHARILAPVRRRRVRPAVVAGPVGAAAKIVPRHVAHVLRAEHKPGARRRRLAQHSEGRLPRVRRHGCPGVPVVARAVGAVGPPIVVRHGADKLCARHKRRARVRRALQYGARHVEWRRGRGVVTPVVARHAVRRLLGAEVVVVRQRAERPVADDARRALRRREPQHAQRVLVRRRRVSKAEARLPLGVCRPVQPRRVGAVVESRPQRPRVEVAAVERVQRRRGRL
mmetsp:Transcript_46489/g.151011  ORF Transcript_46489/g.151011 Transcript_46489/m.151011 type:complete len:298 (-) Transcript_46489:85-978(-)